MKVSLGFLLLLCSAISVKLIGMCFQGSLLVATTNLEEFNTCEGKQMCNMSLTFLSGSSARHT